MSVDVHDEWGTEGFDRPAVAPATGVFSGRAFLQTWWELRRPPDAELCLVESDDGLLALHRTDHRVEFLGEPDLTDYHSPRGDGIAELAAGLPGAVGAGSSIVLDSLPWEAADPIVKGLRDAGCSVEVREHSVAAVLDLPETFDGYLEMLDGKQRHELRRKWRRFAQYLGITRLEEDRSPQGLAEFVRMHRMAAGDKGDFFSEDVERFFAALLELPEARLDLLYGEEGRPVAAGFGFDDADGYYLYNSAYDTSMADASPGIVLLWALIESVIERGKPRFDFLKGDEQYKYRLGAVPRTLHIVEART